ncbi:hypothetical protein MHK_008085 [Candidatus Magnetomorum sp. HK-1]|nr:hypothetical protein MHK_008085 [Candidatus Magnetomorum sp. HK-1]
MTFNGQKLQTLSGSNISNNLIFFDLTLNGSELRLNNDLIILNNLSIITGTFDANDHDIFTSGNWSNDDHFVHSDRTVYLNAKSGEKTLSQKDYFHNLTIGVTGGETTIRLLSSITIENKLRIMSGNRLNLNANNLTIGHQLINQGKLTANGGITAFSRLYLSNSPGYVYGGVNQSAFNDVMFVCEEGARWLSVDELNIDGNLIVDGCLLYANNLDYSGELSLKNNAHIISYTSVPSLNEWGIILFFGLLGGLGVILMRKRYSYLI